MKFLIIGDVVGKSGVDKLKKEIPSLIFDNNIDFVIVNGENSAAGRGIRVKEYNTIKDLNVDCITMGNHIYYRKEMNDIYDSLDRLLLPANVTNIKGNKTLIVNKNNVKIGIFNLLGNVNMGDIFEGVTLNAFDTASKIVSKFKEENCDYIFLDFHAETTAEKIAMGRYLSDKGVTCVFGTHTHVQTSDENIINGMGYITDVGMTGPKDSVLGLKKEIALTRFVDKKYARYECSPNEAMLNGIIVSTDDSTKKVIEIKRISIK